MLRAVKSVLTGVRQAEEVAAVLVGGAVDEVLLCVARDYGLNYSTLTKRYRAAIVRKHAGDADGAVPTCSGTNKDGSRCRQKGTLQGYCKAHINQLIQATAVRRHLEAYRSNAAGAKRRTHAGEVDELLAELGSVAARAELDEPVFMATEDDAATRSVPVVDAQCLAEFL